MTDNEMIASHAAHRIFSECCPPLFDKRFKMELCEKIIAEVMNGKQDTKVPDLSEVLNWLRAIYNALPRQ